MTRLGHLLIEKSRVPTRLGDKVGLSSAAKSPKLLLQESGYLAWLERAMAAASHGFKISSDGEVEVLIGRITTPVKGEMQLSPVSHGILKHLQNMKVWERKSLKVKIFFF